MEVILLQDVDKLGKESELVKVRPGFARNYLIPRKLAVVADDGQKKMVQERIKQQEKREEKMAKQITSIVEVLKNTKYTVGAKTGTSGKIFGSVTTIQLAHAIKKQSNLTIDRKRITLPEDISVLGDYKATVNLHKDVDVEVTFEVVGE